MSRPITGAIVWLGLLIQAGLALADDRGEARLNYSLGAGTERCPDREAIMNGVTARLGYDPWRPDSRQVIITKLEKKGSRLRATIYRLRGEGKAVGSRQLSSTRDDCQELAAAVELAISIAIDPLSLGRRRERPTSKPAQILAPASRPVVPIKREAAIRKRPRPPVKKARVPPAPMHLSAGLGGHVALGVAPGAAGGINLQARMKWTRLSVAIEGRADLPSSGEISGGGIIRSSLLAGGVVTCVHLEPFLGCALVFGGALWARGEQLEQARTVTLPWIAGGVRLGAEIPIIGRVSMRAQGDLLAPFTRISLTESGTDEVFWTLPVLSGTFGICAIVTF